MKYTRYFSNCLKSQGVPQLGNTGFAVLMNIVHLEGRIDGLQRMQEREKVEADKFRYNIWIRDAMECLEGLTHNMGPADLMKTLKRKG